MKNEVYTIDMLRKERVIKRLNHDYSLSGKTGDCFIKGDKIIKLYEYPKIYESNNDLTKYKSSRISFPIDYLYEKGKIIGEVLPYYKADIIDKVVNPRSNIDYLIKSYQEVEDEIKIFPDIMMHDIWTGNILYSNRKGMFLIDTTDWEIKDDNYSSYNIKLLENSLFILIQRLIINRDFNFMRISDNDEILNYLYEYICDGNSLLTLLREYKEMIRKNYNYDIKSVSDAKKYIKIKKIS